MSVNTRKGSVPVLAGVLLLGFLGGCSTAPTVDHASASPSPAPTSQVLQEVTLDASQIAGYGGAAAAFGGTVEWIDVDGYSYSASFTPSFVVTLNLADAKPGEVSIDAVATNALTVRNTTPARDAPQPAMRFVPFWESASAVCTTEYPGRQVQSIGSDHCSLSGFAPGASYYDIVPIPIGATVDGGNLTYPYTNSITISEADASAFVDAANRPAGWAVVVREATVSAAVCELSDDPIVWTSIDVGCGNSGGGSAEGSGSGVPGTAVSSDLAASVVAAIARTPDVAGTLDVCPLGDAALFSSSSPPVGFGSPPDYVSCDFDRGNVTVRSQQLPDTFRDWVVSNAGDDEASYISQAIPFADGMIFITHFPESSATWATWTGHDLIVEAGLVAEGGAPEDEMLGVLQWFTSRLVPMLGQLATS